MLKVVEIFDSIDGEGIRTGVPVTFIRLAGCNLRCRYCDTQYAQLDMQGQEMSIDEIVDKVTFKDVTITGGEPLLHGDSLIELIQALRKNECNINIETNGSVDISKFRRVLRGCGFFTLDYKCPCSGMHNNMLDSNYDILEWRDVVKFVVADDNDLATIREFINRKPFFSNTIYISPCFGEMELPKLVEEVKLIKKAHPQIDIRMQVQLHKIIWEPEKRGV